MNGAGKRVLLGSLLVVGGLALFLTGFPGRDSNIARRLEREPQISVFMHKTGERKTMSMEQYIAGVVAGEMKKGWPVDAYAAQAIFARSFTMELISRGGTRQQHGTDISTNPQEAQAYEPGNITPAIRQAVQKTRGMVMTFNNRFVGAFFHAYAGGQTALAKEGIGIAGPEPPYLKSVRIPDNDMVPAEFKNWTETFTLGEVGSLLARKGTRVGNVTDVRVLAKGATNRVTQVEVVGSEGRKRMHGNDFRAAMNAENPFRLKSMRVNRWEVRNGKLIIQGTGFGHGVGLSQWDTLMFARQGKSPGEIIRFFFRDVEIKKLWD